MEECTKVLTINMKPKQSRYQNAQMTRILIIQEARHQAETKWSGKSVPVEYLIYYRKLFHYVGDLHTEKILKTMEQIENL